MRVVPRLVVAACFAVAVPSSGCAHSSELPVPVDPEPPNVADLDDFELALNAYALLPDDHPQRPEYRARLVGFLTSHLTQALKDGDEEEAHSAMRYAVTLYSPAELRTASTDNGLAGAAHSLYRATARRGAERPSLLALAVQQRFGGESQRAKALEEWTALEEWLTSNGPFADDPLLMHEELERALEDVAASFPTPFVTERLADLYVARYEAAVRSRAHGRGLGTATVRRIEITGYLLMRLYLRADDPQRAVASLDRVELDPPVAKLREVLEDSLKPRRSPRPLLGLAEQFVPDPAADPSLPYVVQGWGIVENLSRRALDRHPKDPFVHLLRAQTLVEAGLLDAAIVHLERSIDLKEDVFEAWQQLAELEQNRLARLAETDPDAAMERLGALEQRHRRAVDLWRDRPIRPGLPEAYYIVAEGLYQVGRVEEAGGLLGKSLALQPGPRSLDLLGTIAAKRGNWDAAQAHYEDLARLAYDSELAQLQWEARARHQLGLIALHRGTPSEAARHLRIALRHSNELLARGEVDAPVRADRYVERGKILFLLGDISLAMNDFRHATELSPGNVKVYADPLLLAVTYGFYEEARTIFRRAMSQAQLAASLKLYFSLWMNELALSQGLSPDPEATTFLAGYDGDAWGRKLAEHARGKLDFDSLLEGAANKGERAEAFFYEGVRAWRKGDSSGGKELLRRVVKTEMMGFFEYDMAQRYLDKGKLPTSAAPPLPSGLARAN